MKTLKLIKKFYKQYFVLLGLLSLIVMLVFIGEFKYLKYLLGAFVSGSIICFFWCDFDALEKRDFEDEKRINDLFGW